MVRTFFTHLRQQWMGALALFFVLTGGTAYALDGSNTVFSDDIVNGEVKNDDLGANSVGAAKIADQQVKNADLGNGAVTQAKLQPPAAASSAGLLNAFGGCPPGANAWEDFSPDVNNEVGYHRDLLGRVHLQGVAVMCGAPPSSLRVFTLPLGYRPARREHHAAVYSTGVKELWIDPNGDVIAINIGSPGNWVSLDGVTFRCTPPGNNGCP
jgi:hypothetical protein